MLYNDRVIKVSDRHEDRLVFTYFVFFCLVLHPDGVLESVFCSEVNDPQTRQFHLFRMMRLCPGILSSRLPQSGGELEESGGSFCRFSKDGGGE